MPRIPKGRNTIAPSPDVEDEVEGLGGVTTAEAIAAEETPKKAPRKPNRVAELDALAIAEKRAEREAAAENLPPVELPPLRSPEQAQAIANQPPTQEELDQLMADINRQSVNSRTELMAADWGDRIARTFLHVTPIAIEVDRVQRLEGGRRYDLLFKHRDTGRQKRVSVATEEYLFQRDYSPRKLGVWFRRMISDAFNLPKT
jgi:hypothetical protein